jgi:O-antigen/teichoic acid export membrane protein
MNIGVLKRSATSPAVRGSLLTVLDQGVCSLSNFLTGVIVARALLPEAFGVYTLFFTGIVLLSGLQNALVVGPLRVLGVRPHGIEASGYFRAQVRLQLILSVILMAGAGITLVTIHRDPLTTIAFLICLLLFQLQELARVIHLTRMTFRTLLRLDVVTHGLRIGLLLAAMSLGLLSTGTVLLIVAASCTGGLAVAGWGSLPKKAPASFRQTSASNWRYGRWLLLESIAYSASTQVYLYLTALWVDAAAVGALSAVLVLLNAVNVILLGTMNHAVPVARQRLLVGGYDPWRQWLLRIGIFLCAGVGAFGFVASLAAEPLLALVYGPAYAASAYLVPIVALQLFLSALNTVLSAAFRTAEMPQVGFAAKVASTIATLVLAYPLLHHWGAAGAAVGLVVTQLLWTTVYIWFVAAGKLKISS